jgi:hypothetical protein
VNGEEAVHMSWSRFTLRSLALAATLAATAGATVPPSQAASAGRAVAAPAGGGAYLEMMGVSSVSPTDAWAVGRRVQFGGADWAPVILHWDGTGWSRFHSPVPGTRTQLSGVSAISPDDAWAVGSYEGSGGQLTLIEHWDGVRWSQVPSPNAGTSGNWLTAVSAVSGHTAWAVGDYVVWRRHGPRRTRTLIEQWDGKSWSQVASPNPGVRKNTLLGVAGDSRDDAWAVGSYTFAPRSGRLVTLALHWDGTGWSQVDTPNPGGRQDVFTAVAATSARHVWAVGAYRGDGKGRQTLIARWTGSAWTQVWSPNPGPTWNWLFGVSAVSPTDVWAGGFYVQTRGVGPYLPLIVHFSRGGWTQVPGPRAGGYLNAISADSASNAWATGGKLLVHWNGTRWTRIKGPGHQRA